MSERALVLSVDKWEMVDEKTGELRRGLSVWYVNEYREDSEASFGLKPTKISAAPELLEHFRKARLPALFDMHYGSRPGAQGKATLTVIKADGIANVNVFSGSAAAKTAA